MPINRFFLDQDLSTQDQYLIEEREFHHLAHVARVQTKEEIELVNGQGQLANAIVLNIKKKSAELLIKTVETGPKPARLSLLQAFPQQSRLDTILEKTTELGVTEIVLFPGEKSSAKTLSERQKERAHTILINAMKQCGRLYLPTLVLYPPIVKWTELPTPTLFFGDPKSTRPLDPSMHPTSLCIGPESGFSKQEEEILLSLSATPFSLHKNVLRTDTAAILGVGLASTFLCQEFDPK